MIDDSFVRCAVVTIYDRDKMHSNEEVDDIDIEACDCDMELNDPYSGMSSDEAFELAQCMDNDLLWDLFSNEIPGISHLYIVYVASDSVIKGA